MLISKFDTSHNDVEKRIDEFGKKFQITLPKEYVNFLTKYNGGMTPETKFKIGKVSSDIVAFYGIGQVDENYCFDRLIQNQIMEEFVKDGMIPIAENVWGDHITIKIAEKMYGEIYFLYHDKKKKYIPLCKNLAEFIGKCKSKKIGHIRTIDERKQCMIENGYGDQITEVTLKCWQAEIDEYTGIHQENVIL